MPIPAALQTLRTLIASMPSFSIKAMVVDYYRQRAKNPNVGLIITEHTYIDQRGRAKANQMSIADDDKISGLRRLVDAIHAVEAAKILTAEGIELLSLTGGMCRFIRKGHNEPGYFLDMM